MAISLNSERKYLKELEGFDIFTSSLYVSAYHALKSEIS